MKPSFPLWQQIQERTKFIFPVCGYEYYNPANRKLRYEIFVDFFDTRFKPCAPEPNAETEELAEEHVVEEREVLEEVEAAGVHEPVVTQEAAWAHLGVRQKNPKTP